MNRAIWLLLCLATIALLGCSKGASLGIPQVKPPVEAITPAGLLAASTSISLQELCSETNIADRVKCRLFSDGPTEILDILAGIDSRMAEIDERSGGTSACLSTTPVDKTSDFTFPGGETFEHHLQCYDQFSDNTGFMAFGKKDTTWYLRQGYEGAAGTAGVKKGIGQVIKVDADQNVSGWIMLGLDTTPPTESTVLLHFSTDQSAGTIEFTAGGENTGFSTVHFKSNSTYIYLKDDSAEFCLLATDYTQTTQSLCDSLEVAITLTTLGCKSGTGCNGSTTANNVDLTTLFNMGKLPVTGVPAFE